MEATAAAAAAAAMGRGLVWGLPGAVVNKIIARRFSNNALSTFLHCLSRRPSEIVWTVAAGEHKMKDVQRGNRDTRERKIPYNKRATMKQLNFSLMTPVTTNY
ncbi:hypothetical protein E2C01_032560 [Portunus trituberculatus]|uniref:Uncharacterized protein n=1 Tax=Portunus trituberculatus TaxID=210409 RepID=A0A5B7EVK8_PORTR|nr:hypothetical protein [Portunus trituberculatus]